MKPVVSSAQELLKRFYGYSSFRPGQWEIIESALQRRDSLVLMPTGGGKSLCYQIPAMMMPGCAIVVSPLIALMNDQVDSLRVNGLPAAALHSNHDEDQNRHAIEQARLGKIKILYVSPERLMADFNIFFSTLKVSMVAIDEAHCISQWGHDFRPVYKKLALIKQLYPDIPVMALTATADRLTRLDISTSLGLTNPLQWIGSFDRPNISLRVMADPGKSKKIEIIKTLASNHRYDSGIVYCLSRRKTEDMTVALCQAGVPTVCYHAGLTPAAREKAQLAFLNGEVNVICATVAFGMGIDKSNIRWVVHNNIPGNIESYYQEIGRAGRDGLPAEALLFYSFADIMARRKFIEDSGLKEINYEKLNSMQCYAEASVCRRRILLSYFGEATTCDCGNCDNCRQPRPRIDGTIIAQKALSAIVRVGSKEAINNIIDILRGSNRSDLAAKGYNTLKTFGAGNDLTSREWHNYILQMIQLGLIEVAYEDNFHLRPTDLGTKTLKGLHRVELAAWTPTPYAKQGGKKRNATKKPVATPEQILLDSLKAMRQKLASKENLPVHVILSDVSLVEIVAKKPQTLEQLLTVTGISEVKAVEYGRTIISTVSKHVTGKSSVPAGLSQQESLMLYEKGLEPEEIAKIKNIQVSTVYSHLIQGVREDKISGFSRLVTPQEYDLVTSAAQTLQGADLYQRMNTYHDIPTYKVLMALALRDWKLRHTSAD